MASSSSLKLQTAGEIFKVSQEFIDMSTTLSSALSRSYTDKTIFVGLIDSTIMKLILEWSAIWESHQTGQFVKEWAFSASIQDPTLITLSRAANFLGIQKLHVALNRFIDREFVNYKMTMGSPSFWSKIGGKFVK